MVKQILTEKSKSSLLESLQVKKQQLQKECEQLKFEMKKNERNIKPHSSKLKTYYNKEIDARKEKIKLLDFQVDQIHILPLGSELKEKDVQALVEIKPGDNWEEINRTKTIVIKEGIIEDIR